MNYDLLSVGGEIGEDKNGGDRGSFVCSGSGSGSVIVQPPHCVIVTPVQDFVHCISII